MCSYDAMTLCTGCTEILASQIGGHCVSVYAGLYCICAKCFIPNIRGKPGKTWIDGKF